METEILFVDDEEVICLLAKRYLGKKEFSVTALADTDTVMQTIDDKNPSVVFLDIKMPKKNGMELLKEIKESHPDTPVVMVSGHLNPDLARQAARLGACDYILKPVDWAHLKNTAHLYSFLGDAGRQAQEESQR